MLVQMCSAVTDPPPPPASTERQCRRRGLILLSPTSARSPPRTDALYSSPETSRPRAEPRVSPIPHTDHRPETHTHTHLYCFSATQQEVIRT